MIQYVDGNIFESNAEALVNAVNTFGVMGKGLALEFKNRYPNNYRIYKSACDSKELQIGSVLVVKENDGKIIVNFPNKMHWKDASKYEYIEKGLNALKIKIKELNIKSIAIPALGCGLGGLKWESVKKLFENELSAIESTIFIYEPK